MGLPIALKDLYSVRGMSTNAGSRVDVSDLVPAQGPFVTALERAGCVLLGKTVTTEFATGRHQSDSSHAVESVRRGDLHE